MNVDHGGAEPQNTPQFIVASHYVQNGWVVRITTNTGDTFDCVLNDLKIESGIGVEVSFTIWDEENPDGETDSIDLEDISSLFVY